MTQWFRIEANEDGLQPRAGRPMWGILGGMGPLASCELVNRIYCRANDGRDEQHMPRLLLHSDCSTPDRSSAILSGHSDALVDHLRRSSASLERAGADILVVACMTAHAFLPHLRNAAGVPVVSLFELLKADLNLQAHNHLLVATNGTRQADLFHGFPNTLKTPDTLTQAAFHDKIYHLKTTGDIDPLMDAVLAAVDAQGCHSVLAGCTEVCMLSDSIRRYVPVLDPMDILVDVICDFANDVALPVM